MRPSGTRRHGVSSGFRCGSAAHLPPHPHVDFRRNICCSSVAEDFGHSTQGQVTASTGLAQQLWGNLPPSPIAMHIVLRWALRPLRQIANRLLRGDATAQPRTHLGAPLAVSTPGWSVLGPARRPHWHLELAAVQGAPERRSAPPQVRRPPFAVERRLLENQYGQRDKRPTILLDRWPRLRSSAHPRYYHRPKPSCANPRFHYRPARRAPL